MRLEEPTLNFRRLTPRDARSSLLSHRSYLLGHARLRDAAREALDGALEIVRARSDALDEARLLAQRGNLEARAGELDAAEQWLDMSLDLRLRLREHRGILLTLAALAVISARKGARDRADDLLARAAQMANEA